MGKPVICVSNNSKWNRYQTADMIMKTHKWLWGILFSYQKFGASSVFCDLGRIALLQNLYLS